MKQVLNPKLKWSEQDPQKIATVLGATQELYKQMTGGVAADSNELIKRAQNYMRKSSESKKSEKISKKRKHDDVEEEDKEEGKKKKQKRKQNKKSKSKSKAKAKSKEKESSEEEEPWMEDFADDRSHDSDPEIDAILQEKKKEGKEKYKQMKKRIEKEKNKKEDKKKANEEETQEADELLKKTKSAEQYAKGSLLLVRGEESKKIEYWFATVVSHSKTKVVVKWLTKDKENSYFVGPGQNSISSESIVGVLAGTPIVNEGKNGWNIDPGSIKNLLIKDKPASNGVLCDCGEFCPESQHKCDKCSKYMHAFCGEGIGPDGFQQARRCKSCGGTPNQTDS